MSDKTVREQVEELTSRLKDQRESKASLDDRIFTGLCIAKMVMRHASLFASSAEVVKERDELRAEVAAMKADLLLAMRHLEDCSDELGGFASLYDDPDSERRVAAARDFLYKVAPKIVPATQAEDAQPGTDFTGSESPFSV